GAGHNTSGCKSSDAPPSGGKRSTARRRGGRLRDQSGNRLRDRLRQHQESRLQIDLVLGDRRPEAHFVERHLEGAGGQCRLRSADVAEVPFLYSTSYSLADHAARCQPREAEERVEPVYDVGGADTQHRRVPLTETEQLDDLPGSESVEHPPQSLRDQLDNPLAYYPLFFLDASRLEAWSPARYFCTPHYSPTPPQEPLRGV